MEDSPFGETRRASLVLDLCCGAAVGLQLTVRSCLLRCEEDKDKGAR